LLLDEGKAEEGEQQRHAEVQRARLGVVQDRPAEFERQRRGVPELEQRPGDRDREDQLAGEAARVAAAGVGVRDDLLQSLAYFSQPFSL
jgi:hypothetical protein